MLRAHRLLLQLPQVQHCTSAAACTDFFASASFSTSAAAQAGKNEAASTSVVVKKDWKAVQLPAAIVNAIPTTTMPGQAFVGDMRSTSGLGMGDGYKTHTDKWLQVDGAAARRGSGAACAAVLQRIARHAARGLLRCCARTATSLVIPAFYKPCLL